jgi:signal transduction histidine kinase
MGRWTESAAKTWVRRNGVALTVLLGLVLIGLFAVTQSGVAIFAIARFSASFNQVANTNLPNLVAASRLSELSQSIVARAPEMTAAGSQTQRQGIVDRLNDRLAALARVLDRMDQSAIDPEQLREVRSQLNALATNLKALDEFVRQRIDADDAFETVMARLPGLAARVRKVTDEALTPRGDSERRLDEVVASSDRARLIAWSAAGLEGITLMLATPAVQTKSRVERVNAELQTLVTRMEGLREQLPDQLRRKIDDMRDNIAQFGLGDKSIFHARRAQIEAGVAIQTSLRIIEQSIDKFVGSVSAILRATQQEISGRSAYFNQTISYFNILIIVTTVLCVAAGAAIFAYVRRAVITRLKDVQEYMRAQVDGRPAAMSTGGADEIGEIAKATQVFVTRIAAARDAAEGASRTIEAAYQELKAAQAKLIQAEKMASLGQLTAGIAHEIKNPLNFVNNFAGLSSELLEELREAAAPAIAALGEDKRAELDEIIEMLTGNLEKIAEHGRRADNIVKGMLEHSRGGTGESRSVDLNGLIDEALNLAYHGARAQDQGFNITLERDLDQALTSIELVPQDITRVFLNLFGNGFYAATKRQRSDAEPGFQPVLKVTTRDFGDAVEVRVRDNGIGIPPEIKDKLFQPFFTTKPTGEGTGLGLSISYDIVVQQHGGTIEVDSRVGEFTEFTMRLPRSPQAASTAAAA